MTKNVGGIDRILRIVVGLGLISLVFVGPQTQWGWIGVIPLLTALAGFCPAYRLIGMNTCSRAALRDPQFPLENGLLVVTLRRPPPFWPQTVVKEL